MANMLYSKAKEKILQGQVNMMTDTIKAAVVSNAYIQSMTTDEFFTSVSAHILGTPVMLSGKSITDGAFDASDVNFADVPAANDTEGVVIYKDTGVAGTSVLLYYADQITGFPMTTSGAAIEIKWDNGDYKIFKL